MSTVPCGQENAAPQAFAVAAPGRLGSSYMNPKSAASAASPNTKQLRTKSGVGAGGMRPGGTQLQPSACEGPIPSTFQGITACVVCAFRLKATVEVRGTAAADATHHVGARRCTRAPPNFFFLRPPKAQLRIFAESSLHNVICGGAWYVKMLE